MDGTPHEQIRSQATYRGDPSQLQEDSLFLSTCQQGFSPTRPTILVDRNRIVEHKDLRHEMSSNIRTHSIYSGKCAPSVTSPNGYFL